MPGTNNIPSHTASLQAPGAKPSPTISVVIPAKDEARSIGDLVDRVKSSLAGLSASVIVVDDGSQDTTSRIARRNGTVVLRHEKNLGKGSAMKTGAAHASGDIVVFIDADGQHDPDDIRRVIQPILEGRADLVNGSRALPDSHVAVSPLRRRLSNNLASIVISLIVSALLPAVTFFRCPVRRVWITDCTSGFRAVTKEGWRRLDLISEGFQIETEMIYEAVKNGLVVAEVPVSCRWDGRLSHLSIARDGSKTVGLLLKKLAGDFGGRRITRSATRPSLQAGREQSTRA